MAFEGMLRRYDCNKLKIHGGKCRTENEAGDLISMGLQLSPENCYINSWVCKDNGRPLRRIICKGMRIISTDSINNLF